jgi:cation diffusion facilitator CzcD-associated flavoprotein CzcO
VAGFPNLFLMLGPNTGTGHTSTLLYIEPQARYAVACMQAVRSRGLRQLALKAGVMQAHNEALQARLAGERARRANQGSGLGDHGADLQ